MILAGVALGLFMFWPIIAFFAAIIGGIMSGTGQGF